MTLMPSIEGGRSPRYCAIFNCPLPLQFSALLSSRFFPSYPPAKIKSSLSLSLFPPFSSMNIMFHSLLFTNPTSYNLLLWLLFSWSGRLIFRCLNFCRFLLSFFFLGWLLLLPYVSCFSCIFSALLVSGFSEKKRKNNKFESLVVSLSFFLLLNKKKKDENRTRLSRAVLLCGSFVCFPFLFFFFLFPI